MVVLAIVSFPSVVVFEAGVQSFQASVESCVWMEGGRMELSAMEKNRGARAPGARIVAWKSSEE